jgi:hypothetical protein
MGSGGMWASCIRRNTDSKSDMGERDASSFAIHALLQTFSVNKILHFFEVFENSYSNEKVTLGFDKQ